MPTRHKSKGSKKYFTVVGFYRDNDQPYVNAFMASTPEGAIRKCPAGLMIVDVFKGSHHGVLGNDELEGT